MIFFNNFLELRNNRVIPVLALVGLLSGCLATTNLAVRGSGLPDDYADIAKNALVLANANCIKVTGRNDQSKDDWTKGRKMDTGDWIARRFYTSNSDWYKIEAGSQGIIDDIYYNKKSLYLVCGSHSWGKFAEARSVEFTEYGTKVQSLSGKTYSKEQGESNGRKTVLKRAVAISWEGYAKLMAGEIEINEGEGPSIIRIDLPGDAGKCSGIARNIDKNSGVWSMSCSNGASASGTFSAYGSGKGATGQGRDTNGRLVEYTISGR